MSDATIHFIATMRAERARLTLQLNVIDNLLRVYEQTSGYHLPKSRDPRDVLLDEDFDEMEICR